MRLGGLILGENIDKMPVKDDNKLLLPKGFHLRYLRRRVLSTKAE